MVRYADREADLLAVAAHSLDLLALHQARTARVLAWCPGPAAARRGLDSFRRGSGATLGFRVECLRTENRPSPTDSVRVGRDGGCGGIGRRWPMARASPRVHAPALVLRHDAVSHLTFSTKGRTANAGQGQRCADFDRQLAACTQF